MLEFIPVTVKFKKLLPDANVPTYSKFGDAGADLYSTETVTIEPQEVIPVQTGIAIEIPYGYVGLIHPRSGLTAKKTLTVANAPGTVDAGYRGEILVLLTNFGRVAQTINKGDRIAQLVFQKFSEAHFEEVSELSSSDRNSGGFGHTGN